MLLSEVIAELQAVLAQKGDLTILAESTASRGSPVYTSEFVEMLLDFDEPGCLRIDFWEDEEAAWDAGDEEEEEAPEYSLGVCQKCGEWDEHLLAVDAEAPPTPECPMGYGSELWLCPGCLQKWEERHAENERPESN